MKKKKKEGGYFLLSGEWEWLVMCLSGETWIFSTLLIHLSILFHKEDRYYIETSPLICSANQNTETPLFKKVAGYFYTPGKLQKTKEALVQMFSCEFCEIFKNTFLTGHLQATTSVKMLLYSCYHFDWSKLINSLSLFPTQMKINSKYGQSF